MKSFRFPRLKKNLQQLCLGFGVAAIAQLSLFANPSFANPRQITFSVYPADSGAAFPICPTEFSLTETPRPYYEGGYTIDGSASLGWFAKQFKIETSDRFSVTWAAKLQTKYHNCIATAKITTINGEAFRGHSYLRVRFMDGNVYLILDMTGMNDANSLTAVILKKDVKNGNPIWTWGGTD
ncbi:hypothetical protein [Pseudanabaena sp. ABRG5-3]|uniref:hypothetical protein n=1 Tax=Pseudanabaena sp. ABRG5-3 TaxID=685565 RepID=UPI000F81BE9E|nr:hypothetical protein [Pseudanabaena sp. ABRG5-3]